MRSHHHFRGLITILIVVGFFAAYFMDPGNETMKGALIAAFAGAWGFYLGSSQGARDSREAMHRQLERNHPTEPPHGQPKP